MADGVIINLCMVEASELLTHVVTDLIETAQSARELVFQRENFAKFSTFLEKTSGVLKQFSSQNLDLSDSLALKNALEVLEREVKSAAELVVECRERNKVYLLVNCRKIIESIETSTREISQALSLIPLASLDVSLSIKAQIAEICDDMLEAKYRANVAEEKILETIELGIQDRNRSRSHANELLQQIAEALGLSTEHSALTREYQEFKRDIEEAKLRKEKVESSQMEQIMALLEKADATTSSKEREKKYIERRDSLGSQNLSPLQGFICGLSQKVMVNPVETSSGQTFERDEIEKWIADGNVLCPLTQVPLDVSYLMPNRTLRKSIEEWRERNSIITIGSIKQKLSSEDEEEVSKDLRRLQSLCEQSESYLEWVAMEDYVPVLIKLLGGRNREIRESALKILCILANHTEESKEKIINIGTSLELIVRSLGKKHEESKMALRLLLCLSRSDEARRLIGNVHGCILLVVTMLNSEDDEVARDSEELIEILSFLEENVKEMANKNYFRPLLQLLSSGPEDVKIRMAETLAEIKLTDLSKLSIVVDGGLNPLIEMLSDDDLKKKEVSIKCLVQLSSLLQNGSLMLRQGIIRPLFEILYRHSLQLPTLREQVAETIMYLSISAANQDSDIERVHVLESEDDVANRNFDSEHVRILESEDDVFKFFSLVSLSRDKIKQSILGACLALCKSHYGSDIRIRLRQISSVQVLVQLCERENQGVRANAVKLFCCLAEDSDDSTFLEHVNQKFINTVLRIIENSSDTEEVSAGLGIIAHLPKVQHMTQWLIDAEALRIIHTCLIDGTRDSACRMRVRENGVRALFRFTVSTNQDWQMRVAQSGIIGLLVQFLTSGNAITQRNAAIALKQLSESSKSLSKPVKKHSWALLFCGSAPKIGCPVHSGICGVESSFCLLEANAVGPLVRLFGERDLETREATLDALLTLVDVENPEDGSRVLDKANAITPIIRLLSSNCVGIQEKCLKALDMIFQLDDLNRKYGNSVQMPLIDITQSKACDRKELRSLAAKILSQMGVLGINSSFF